MGLILPLLFLGLMASLSPATIVVFVLILGTAKARVNAVGFLFGWGLSLTIVFGASYVLAASGVGRRGDGRTVVAILEILLGVGLLVASARLWLRETTVSAPPEGSTSAGWGTERLMSRMETLTPVGAAVVGVLKQPWAITTAAALVVVHSQATGILAAIAFALFTLASTATVLVMFVYYARYPGDAQERLAAVRDRAVAAGPAVGAVVGMLVGAFLAVDGLLGLT
jgi:Sap, sulfolipid-1-addressing protein